MPPDSPIRRRLLGAAAAAVAATAAGAVAQTLNPPPLVLGQVSLSFYAVTGAVVQEVLERLGHVVSVRTGAHDEMFPLLGSGELDLMAAAWLPEGHGAYWARHGGAALEVARLYDGARFFWAVPDYVPPAEVASIADLAQPAVAARMARQIQGIGPAATITKVSQDAIRAYGLDGYSLKPGTQAEWTGAFDAAIRERRWFVFPTWAPQYLNRGGRLRPLADPKAVLGGSNHGALVAPRARFDALPEATRNALSRIELGMAGVTDMDWMVNVDRMAPRDAARAWMRANSARVEAWLRA